MEPEALINERHPDQLLSSNAYYAAILVSRSGSPDGRFWPDRVSPFACLSPLNAHHLPQYSEEKERLWTVAKRPKMDPSCCLA